MVVQIEEPLISVSQAVLGSISPVNVLSARFFSPASKLTEPSPIPIKKTVMNSLRIFGKDEQK